MDLNDVEWDPSNYQVCDTLGKFGINPSRSRARHRFVEDIAESFGTPKWVKSTGADLVCGSGKAERDLQDFIYFASPGDFKYWVFALPPHIDIPESATSHWRAMATVDSALLGDALATRWISMIHGELDIPELQEGFGWRHLGTIGMRCLELNIAPEYHNREDKRISHISDSIGQFIYIPDDGGNRVMTNDFHVPFLTLSKVRRPPWVLPARISGLVHLSVHVLIRVLGGMKFWSQIKRYLISEHIAGDALRRSTPTAVWYWVSQHHIKKSNGTDRY